MTEMANPTVMELAECDEDSLTELVEVSLDEELITFPTNNLNLPPIPIRKSSLYRTPSEIPIRSKRESVIALPKIIHLQHQFSKLSLKKELRPKFGVSALNGGIGSMEEENELDEEEYESLISPSKPTVDSRLPWEKDGNELSKSIKSEKEFKREIINLLSLLLQKWEIHYTLFAQSTTQTVTQSTHTVPITQTPTTQTHSILDLLEITTTTIRAIQSYCHSLPSSTAQLSPSQELRSITLDLLGELKFIEANYRIITPTQHTLPELDEAEEELPSLINSNSSEGTISPSQSISFSTTPLPQYQPITLSDLLPQQAVAAAYIQKVDKILFRDRAENNKARKSSSSSIPSNSVTAEAQELEGGRRTPSIGHRRKPKLEGETITIALGGENEESEESLPNWATPTARDELVRAYDIIISHLNEKEVLKLVNPNSLLAKESFLETLSDGNLLCLAYNEVLTLSTRAFGFIPSGSIHSLAGTTEEKVGTTFRKIENLTVFAAALKFRYLIPLGSTKNKAKEGEILFEPKVIARKGERWEEMMEAVVKAWTAAVVEEKREEASVLN